MAESKRPGDERAMRVDVPAELRAALKIEAIEFDVPLRNYLRTILEDRVPPKIRRNMEAQAKARGMTFRELLLEILEQAGMTK